MLSACVVIPCRNAAQTIHSCVTSILNNDYPSFEVIVVDDCSEDESVARLESINDPRLRVLKTPFPSGSGRARNLGAASSRAELVFFTDADCRVSPLWISSGVKALEDSKVVAVEGPIYRDREAQSFVDKLPVNPFYHSLPTQILNQPKRDFACGNVAYRRLAFDTLGGFRGERFTLGREDTDLAWRAKTLGAISYAKEMSIHHASEVWTWTDLKSSALRYRDDVTFYKVHGHFFFKWMCILHPRFFLLMVFPFLLPFYYPIRSREELRFVGEFYLYLVRLRLTIWRAAFAQRVFVI